MRGFAWREHGRKLLLTHPYGPAFCQMDGQMVAPSQVSVRVFLLVQNFTNRALRVDSCCVSASAKSLHHPWFEQCSHPTVSVQNAKTSHFQPYLLAGHCGQDMGFDPASKPWLSLGQVASPLRAILPISVN